MIEFQSAHPVRGATFFGFRILPAPLFQSTRPVWGATVRRGDRGDGHPISIHAPRVGRDVISRKSRPQESRFQSTRPVWGATTNGVNLCMTSKISIHAPRVGRDNRSIQGCHQGQTFQSTRPVWGATVTCCANHPIITLFQSTRPVWGATLKRRLLDGRTFISIHAPRVGRDPEAAAAHKDEQISIHAPRVGRDSKFDDFTPSNLHKRYKRVLARPKNTREKGKIKQKLAYIHAFSAFLGCEGSGTFCALVLRTQYR